MRNRLAITYLKPSTISPAPFQDLRRPRAKYDHAARFLPSRRRRLVSAHVRGADTGAGRGLAGDPLGSEHADRGADRLGQDAGRVPGRDRRSGPPRRRAGAAGRDRRRLRLAAEGAVERHAHQSRSADRRHPRRAACSSGCPTSRSARWCAPATRRRPSATGCASGRRTSWSRRRSRCTSCSGSESGRRMLSTTRTVIVDEMHALAPNKRGTHLALSLERLEALCGRRLTRIGLVGDAEADRGSGEVPDGLSSRIAEPGPSFRR